MQLHAALLVCVLLSRYFSLVPSIASYYSETDADVIIGGLFPVHKNEDGSCGEILDLGVQRLEAMVLAIDMVNDDPALLPGLRIGFDIRDTCTQTSTALQSSLDFLVGLDSEVDPDILDEEKNITTDTVGITGVIGSASSSESISTASLLRLFNKPQISYASTARILSDKTRFEYFLRTLPPDLFQARVMVELVIEYNWTYVIAIHSDDIYGQEGIDAFVDELDKLSNDHNNVTNGSMTFCIAGNPIAISVTATAEEYNDVIRQINKPWIKNSSIVILFGQLATAEGVFEALKQEEYSNHRPLSFIVSDAVGNNLHHMFYSSRHSLISVLPEYRESKEFNEYFTSLTPNGNSNPWFTEYWESVFDCVFNATTDTHQQCQESTQSLSRSTKYEQNSKVPFVLDAVYAFAHAIHNLLSTNCGNMTICKNVQVNQFGRMVINGDMLLKHLHEVSFSGFSADTIDFDENGDQPGGYWINNLQFFSSGNYGFVRIAEWNAEMNLEMNQNPVYWGEADIVPVSICSNQCPNGFEPVIVQGEASCCWNCELCQGPREVSFGGSKCIECRRGFSPNANRSICIENPLDYLKWSDAVAIIIILLSLIGMFCTATVAFVFIICHKHKIVKASSRELSAILLGGIYLCFLIPFLSIGKPTIPTCIGRRFLFGFSFSLCYAALLVRSNRIHRIFNRSLARSSQRPPLISPQVQIFFTCLLVCVQIIITLAWIVVEVPGVEYIYYDDTTKVTCRYTPYIGVIVSLGYNLLLLLSSTYFAFRTRKIPQNFNEARYINLTLFAVMTIWFAFIPIYISLTQLENLTVAFGSSSELFSIQLSAFATLFSLFFTKFYYMVSAKRKQCESLFS